MSITRHQSVGAYRPWQPPDFGVGDEAATSLLLEADAGEPLPDDESLATDLAADAAADDDEAAIADVALKLPTVEEIERIHEDARAAGREEGFAAGHEEGHAAGFAEGKSAGHAAGVDEGRQAGHAEGYASGYDAGYADGSGDANEAGQRLRHLVAEMDSAFASLQHEVAQELLALAREIARRMVGEVLVAHPETIITTVQAALAQIPQGHAQIHLHPDDLPLVRQHLAEHVPQSAPRLIEDGEVSRGGCRIETGAMLVDASLETRWRRVLESLEASAGEAQAQAQGTDGNEFAD